MKKKDFLKNLRTKDTQTIFKELQKSYQQFFEEKFKFAMRKDKNYRHIPSKRKEIARMWTILGEKVISKVSEVNNDKKEEKS